MKRSLRTKQALKGLAFISPWIIGFLAFKLWPLIQTFILSLNNVQISTSGIIQNPIGWKNYQDAFLLDVEFTSMIIDYVTSMALNVPIILVVSLILAMLLNTGVKGQSFFRTIFFLPVIIVSGPVIQKLMDQGSTTLPGLNDFVSQEVMYQAMPEFFADIFISLITSFIVLLWFSGVQILIFLAGLQQTDNAVYEAARIDGASGWEIFWKITLPSLKGIILLNVVYTVVSLSQFSNNPIIEKIQGSIFNPAEGGLGFASAMSWIYFLIMAVVLIIFIIIFSGGRRDG